MYVHMLLVMQVTKVDMCPANILKQTLDELTKILKSPVRSILFMKWRFFFFNMRIFDRAARWRFFGAGSRLSVALFPIVGRA